MSIANANNHQSSNPHYINSHQWGIPKSPFKTKSRSSMTYLIWGYRRHDLGKLHLGLYLPAKQINHIIISHISLPIVVGRPLIPI